MLVKTSFMELATQENPRIICRDFIDNEKKYDYFLMDIEPLVISISFTYVIRVKMRWCYTNADTVCKDFPRTWNDFRGCCEWIDKTRKLFAQKLLI